MSVCETQPSEWRAVTRGDGVFELAAPQLVALFGKSTKLAGLMVRAWPSSPSVSEYRLSDGHIGFSSPITMPPNAAAALHGLWPFSGPMCCICSEHSEFRKPMAVVSKRPWWSRGHTYAASRRPFVPCCKKHEGDCAAFAMNVLSSHFMAVSIEFLWQFTFWNTLDDYPPPWIRFGSTGWRSPLLETWKNTIWQPFWVALSAEERAVYRGRWHFCSLWPESSAWLDEPLLSPMQVYSNLACNRMAMLCHGRLWRRLLLEGVEVPIPKSIDRKALMGFV